MVSLDFERGGGIAKNLFSLYTWFNQELLEANIAQDLTRIGNVRSMLADLRNAWAGVVTQNTVEDAGRPSAGINIAG
jgi:flagellar protein FliS